MSRSETGSTKRRRRTVRKANRLATSFRLSRWIVLLLCVVVTIAASRTPAAQDNPAGDNRAQERAEQAPRADEAAAAATTKLVRIPLPIRDEVDLTVRSQLEKLLNDLPAQAERPILVLEFAAPEGSNGEGSQFERALSLARFLASERMNRVRTVAYLPGRVVGHAVLPVLACEEIAVAESAELGDAGRGEESIDQAMRDSYTGIAALRRTVPPAVALGMLVRDLEVLRVETLEAGVSYITSDELAELQKTKTVSNVKTIVGKGDLAKFTGRQLRLEYGFASQLANSREALARELKIPAASLAEPSAVEKGWSVVQVELNGRVTSESVTRLIRLLQDRLRRGGSVLIVLRIDSPGGSPADSIRLANYLAGLDRNEARTCAFIDDYARADAALAALACDDIAMSSGSHLGGPGDRFLRPEELTDLVDPLRQLAKAKGRQWSLLMAMIDPQLQVFRHTREGTGEVRYFSGDELAEQPDADAWSRGPQVALSEGLTPAQVRQLGLLTHEAENVTQLLQHYEVRDHAEVLEAGWMISRIEQLASQVWFSRTLLFIAFFALITEASTPGLGAPGFISAMCFLLFFWAQFLNGSAGWLEVILFLGGVICVTLEIFVLPGFGIFGIGGALMMIISIILASQTFVIPRNTYQFEQLPSSLFTVVAAGVGCLAAIFIMSRYMGQTPLLRNLMLTPPDGGPDGSAASREAMIDLSHLLHKPGVTTTLMAPAGKARFGDEIVDAISDGELISPGQPVHVIEVRGNYVIVRPVENNS